MCSRKETFQKCFHIQEVTAYTAMACCSLKHLLETEQLYLGGQPERENHKPTASCQGNNAYQAYVIACLHQIYLGDPNWVSH